MRKIFAAIIILTAFTSISYADIVYTTSNGSLGVIPVDDTTSIGTPSVMYSGLGSDILVGSYNVRTDPYVMVVNRSSNPEVSDTALIFSASNLTSPAEQINLNGIYNTKKFGGSYNGRSIFFASQGNTSLVEFDTSSIDIPINAYMYTNTSEDAEYEPEFVDMAVGTSYISALFRATPDKIELLTFDGQLKEGIKNTRRVTIRNDATNLAELASNRFAVGSDEGIIIVNISSIKTLVSTDYPVKSICRDSDSGLYYVEQSVSGDINLLHSDIEGSNINLIDSMQGTSDCQLVRDSNNNILAAMIGDSIYLYDMKTDVLLASFDASSLGGTPLNIAVSRVEYDDGKSSSSNCNVSCAGVILAVVLGFALRRR